MIEYLMQNENSRTKDLYSEVFCEDSEQLIEFYYNNKARDSRIIACENNNEVVGMLHLCPKNIVINGSVHVVNYIYAVATKYEYRRQGIMSKMLERVIVDMEADGAPFTYLVPANEDVYKKFQFTTVAERYAGVKRRDVTTAKKIKFRKAGRKDAELLAGFAQAVLPRRYSMYARHDMLYFLDVINQLEADGGQIDLFYDDDAESGPAGYIMSYPDDEVREWLFDEKHYDILKSDGDRAPFVMARILNFEKFMELFRSEHIGTYTIGLRDSYICKNNGIFDIDVTDKGCAVAGSDKIPLYNLSIEEFTAHVFGYKIIEGLPLFFKKNDIFINDEM